MRHSAYQLKQGVCGEEYTGWILEVGVLHVQIVSVNHGKPTGSPESIYRRDDSQQFRGMEAESVCDYS
jgi:hypothetical protein